jgi:formyl-CoA transferase
VTRVAELDAAIATWTATRTLDEVLAALNEARIPAGRIYDVADIAADPHYRAREMIVEAKLPDGTPIQVPGIVPKLSETPGAIGRDAPALGEHTDEILGAVGIDAATRDAWRARGIV